jgi:hypothetical protein
MLPFSENARFFTKGFEPIASSKLKTDSMIGKSQ